MATNSNGLYAAADLDVDNFIASVGDLESASKRIVDAMGSSGTAAKTAAGDVKGLSDVLGTSLVKTASTAADMLGEVAANAMGLDKASGFGKLAATGISEGLKAIISSTSEGLKAIVSSTSVYGAVGAAVAYVAYELYDYASGAKAAREALEKLTKTAKEWDETNAITAFEKSEGLRSFGLTEYDFGVDSGAVRDWATTIIGALSKGKMTSGQIIAEMIGNFSAGSDALREQLIGIQNIANSHGAGDSGIFGELDARLADLDRIDSQIEELFNTHREDPSLEWDFAELQRLYDEREAIAVEYNLVESGTGGFDSIVQGAEAALSRGANAESVWADAYTAASQGQAAYIGALNAEYDARYRVIDLMEEGEEKQEALNSLKTWYSEESAAGVQAYADALASVAAQTGAFEDGGKYAATMGQLKNLESLMGAYMQDPFGSGDTLNGIQEIIANMDEAQVVEMTAALAAMDAAGVEMSEDMAAAAEAIKLFSDAANGDAAKYSEKLIGALDTMFGKNLTNELHELNIGINAENLNSVVDAWLQGEHAPLNVTPEIKDTNAIEVPATGDIETLQFSQRGFTNSATPRWDYDIASRGANKGDTDKWWGIFTSSDIQRVNSYAEAIRNYNAAVAAFESGDPSVTAQDVNELRQEIHTLGQDAYSFLDAPGELGSGFNDMAALIADGLHLLSEGKLDTTQIEDLMSLIADFEIIAEAMDGIGSWDGVAWAENISEGLSESFSSEDLSINWENVVASSLATVLDEAVTSAMEQAKPKMQPAGESAAQGYGEAMANTDLSPYGEATAQNGVDAVWNGQQSGSPAKLYNPAGESAAQGYGEGMANTHMSPYAAALIQNTLSAAQGNASGASTIGSMIAAGVAAGIASGQSGVVAAAVNMVKAAINAANAEAQIHSPSKVTTRMGRFWDEGWAVGIERYTGTVTDAASRMVDRAAKIGDDFAAVMSPDLEAAVRHAVYVEPPAGAAYGAARESAQNVRVTGQTIDYDRLADAMNQRQLALYMNDRRMAQVMAAETARAQNARSRSIALGYGK